MSIPPNIRLPARQIRSERRPFLLAFDIGTIARFRDALFDRSGNRESSRILLRPRRIKYVSSKPTLVSSIEARNARPLHHRQLFIEEICFLFHSQQTGNVREEHRSSELKNQLIDSFSNFPPTFISFESRRTFELLECSRSPAHLSRCIRKETKTPCS